MLTPKYSITGIMRLIWFCLPPVWSSPAMACAWTQRGPFQCFLGWKACSASLSSLSETQLSPSFLGPALSHSLLHGSTESAIFWPASVCALFLSLFPFLPDSGSLLVSEEWRPLSLLSTVIPRKSSVTPSLKPPQSASRACPCSPNPCGNRDP